MSATGAPGPARLAPEHLAAVPTPALVVDLAVARRNHTRAVAMLPPGAKLRPHFKAHKSTALAKLTQTGDVHGVACQTTWEALALADAGFDDIMLTNEVVDRAALRELAEAARRARVSVLVDAPLQVNLLQEAATNGGISLDVLIEVDVGMHRCGVPADSDALLGLAAAVARSGALHLLGIQAYEGHAASVIDPAERRRITAASADAARLAVHRLNAAGYAIPVIGGGSTGTLPLISGLGVWTDVQAGSYLLMDGAYGEFPDLLFEPALFGLTTVLHRSEGKIVLDGGLKQFSVDRGNPIWQPDPVATLRLSDEHTKVLSAAGTLPEVGERTLLIPRHIDPTINLHPALWLYEEGVVTAVDVDGRMPRRGN